MHDLIYGSGAVVGWMAFAYKVNHLRRDWANPALRAICAAFGFSALAFTLTVGPVYVPFDAILGVPNLAKLFIHASMVLFAIFVLRLLAFWQYPAQTARWRSRLILSIGLVVPVVMSVLILLAPIHDRYTIDFWKTHAGQTFMTWYLTIYLVSLGVALLAIAYRSWRFAAPITHVPWLRRGLWFTAAGACISFGYCACRGVYLAALSAGLRVDALVDIAEPFASVGQIVFFAGLTIPSWGSRISDLSTRIEQVRAYRALKPLWSALYEAFPDIALHPPAPESGEDRAAGDLDYRVYRRMVEIWDGRLALRPYITTATAFAPAGHSAETTSSLTQRADAEARAIIDGLRARRQGRLSSGTPAGEEHNRDAASTNELEWLIAVSRAFARMSKSVPAHLEG